METKKPEADKAEVEKNKSVENKNPQAPKATETETVEANEEVELEEHNVLREFTADKVYRVGGKFSSQNAETVASLKINKYIN